MSELDLHQLAMDRGAPPQRAGPPRRIVSRYVLPAGVVAGFALLVGWAARDRLLPSTPVTVVPVVVTEAEIEAAGAPVFQAAGWIEPRPTPVVVTSLVEGVIESLLVVQGQDVKAGDPVAKLLDTDARLALRQAEAERQLKDAELAGARAELAAAKIRLEQPVHLEAALGEADSLLAQAEKELARLPFDIEAAEARATVARQDLEGKQAARQAISGRLVQIAQGELAEARAKRAELEERGPYLRRAVASLKQRRDALARQLELKVDESRQMADAEAKVKAAEARQQQAKLAVEAATLHLNRMTVLAPAAGRVLDLAARPGTRLAGLATHAGQDASTVVTLYDPGMLQVRCDVRLEDVARVQPGQPVRIETASAPAPIEGEVLLVTSAANVQKNTLEVKVAILKPPASIRPEMLVQATFLAPKSTRQEAAPGKTAQKLLAPRSLVEQTADGSFVWLAAADGTARRQRVKTGRAAAGELVEITEGLTPTDRLISGGRERLREGERVRIAGEDASLGVGN